MIPNKIQSVQPIFIFSLPRSGSTLLQRMLGAHERIATVSEPWFLLPLFYTLKQKGLYAEYDHRCVNQAMADLIECIPGKKSELLRQIKDFSINIYSKLSHEGATFFLDKTPRYHLIIDEIIETFPDAKFIFLWRNPLSIASSINETWANGKWKLYAYKVDIYKGMENLVDAYGKYKNCSLSIRYEDLVSNPELSIRRVCSYLDIAFDKQMISSFSQTTLSGGLGDPTGVKKYSQVSEDSLGKWVLHYSNPLRRIWAKKYLRWIGRDRLSAIGYCYDDIEQALSSNKVIHNNMLSDGLRMVFGELYCFFEPVIFLDKIKTCWNGKKVCAHR